MYKWIIIFSLAALPMTATASSFSSEDFFKKCLSEGLDQQYQQKCKGFFYGLLASQELSGSENTLANYSGIMLRAMQTRLMSREGKPADTLTSMCLPSDLTAGDFSAMVANGNHAGDQPLLDANSFVQLIQQNYPCE